MSGGCTKNIYDFSTAIASSQGYAQGCAEGRKKQNIVVKISVDF
jgi:hypothetical protein